MADKVLISVELLEALADDGECWFDHHGGCQEHGYLALKPGERCPQSELREILRLKGAGSRPNIEAIKARRDWRVGKDLSPFELRLDDECLANHYSEDVTTLIDYIVALESDWGSEEP